MRCEICGFFPLDETEVHARGGWVMSHNTHKVKDIYGEIVEVKGVSEQRCWLCHNNILMNTRINLRNIFRMKRLSKMIVDEGMI